jgi:hypothetical protein
MANPYIYGADGSYDQRWGTKNGTSTTRLNYSRLMSDHLRWWIDKLLDTTSTYALGTWQNPYKFANGAAYIWFDTTTGMFRGRRDGTLPGTETDGDFIPMG